MSKVFEVNFDGLVGLSHNYSGLSSDNIACTVNKGRISHPKKAALQGLEKMKFLMDLGIKQGVLPPQERPFIPLLKLHGFSGTDAEILKSAAKDNPLLLSQACSAASMWAANAATITPSTDSKDGKVHITPANLYTEVHRRIEANTTHNVLKEIFRDAKYFNIHKPLSGIAGLTDEGAANHTRLCPKHSNKGLHIFVYGKSNNLLNLPTPKNYTGRQSLEASQAIAQLHGIDEDCCLFIQQNPEAIDAGVFHNDVICVGNENVLFFHENAFVAPQETLHLIFSKYKQLFNQDLVVIKATNHDATLKDIVETYLFNSQIVTLNDNTMSLIAPKECQKKKNIHSYLDKLINKGQTPIQSLHMLDVHESMKNGGGPACLRLRVILNQDEISALNGRVMLDQSLYVELRSWINEHYRDELSFQDLDDIALLNESRIALEELFGILKINPHPSND